MTGKIHIQHKYAKTDQKKTKLNKCRTEINRIGKQKQEEIIRMRTDYAEIGGIGGRCAESEEKEKGDGEYGGEELESRIEASGDWSHGTGRPISERRGNTPKPSNRHVFLQI